MRLPIGVALLVGLGVDLVVEVVLLGLVEAGCVAPQRARAVLVAVLGVLDQVRLGEVEALGLSLAGLDQGSEGGIDRVVRALGPVWCHARKATTGIKRQPWPSAPPRWGCPPSGAGWA